ncbi:hypothetical protein QMG_1855, partial [Clostridioides difficile DA00256]
YYTNRENVFKNINYILTNIKHKTIMKVSQRRDTLVESNGAS